MAADERYDVASGWLRAKTRNRKDYPLVFAENKNYGFERNLCGMQKFGIASGLAALALLLIASLLSYYDVFQVDPLGVGIGGIAIGCDAAWLDVRAK